MNSYGFLATVVICITVVIVVLIITSAIRDMVKVNLDKTKAHAENDLKMAELFEQTRTHTPPIGNTILPTTYSPDAPTASFTTS